jgi:hypothetical protein
MLLKDRRASVRNYRIVHRHNERENMSKFIRLKTTTGADLLLRTKYIFSVCGCPEKSFTRIQLCNAIDHDDAYDVVQTVDEIQAMMHGEPPKSVAEQSPEPEACDDPIARKVQEIERQKTQTVQMAIDIGKHLIEAKSQLKHGEWLPWLQQNFPHSTTSAGHYMRMAQHVDLTKERPTSIREALQQITDAEEKQPQTKQSLTDAVLHMMKSSQQSRYAISQKSGISQAVLSRFVNGERLLGMRTLERLAEALGHKITLVPEAKEST